MSKRRGTQHRKTSTPAARVLTAERQRRDRGKLLEVLHTLLGALLESAGGEATITRADIDAAAKKDVHYEPQPDGSTLLTLQVSGGTKP